MFRIKAASREAWLVSWPQARSAAASGQRCRTLLHPVREITRAAVWAALSAHLRCFSSVSGATMRDSKCCGSLSSPIDCSSGQTAKRCRWLAKAMNRAERGPAASCIGTRAARLRSTVNSRRRNQQFQHEQPTCWSQVSSRICRRGKCLNWGQRPGAPGSCAPHSRSSTHLLRAAKSG